MPLAPALAIVSFNKLITASAVPSIAFKTAVPVKPSATSGQDGAFNLLDSGANADSKPEHLYQYALLGTFLSWISTSPILVFRKQVYHTIQRLCYLKLLWPVGLASIW